MTTELISPPRGMPLGDPKIIFLAGPIKNAPDWQKTATELLVKDLPSTVEMCIANPRTEGKWHGDYNGQVDWELEYLNRAARTGAILFWLALPDPTLEMSTEEFGLMMGLDSQRPTRTYAQTSRFELGEWVGRTLMAEKAPFILGIEPGFTNEKYIRRRILHLRDQEIPTTLKRTVELARERLLSL